MGGALLTTRDYLGGCASGIIKAHIFGRHSYLAAPKSTGLSSTSTVSTPYARCFNTYSRNETLNGYPTWRIVRMAIGFSVNSNLNPGQLMKKLFTGALIAVASTAISAFACGGMTQIDPPSLQLNAGPSNDDIDSAVPDLASVVVLC